MVWAVLMFLLQMMQLLHSQIMMVQYLTFIYMKEVVVLVLFTQLVILLQQQLFYKAVVLRLLIVILMEMYVFIQVLIVMQ